MKTVLWDTTVTVLGERPGIIDNIRDTRAAARFLVERWPAMKRDRPKHRAAQKACLDVLEGRAFGPYARKAFEAAARDAKIYVRTSADGRL